MPPDSYSRLADTAPALLGVVAILAVLVPVGLYMARLMKSAIDRTAVAIDNNTVALAQLRERDDSRADRHFETLRQLGEHCLGDHRIAVEKMETIAAGVRRIEDHLGKTSGSGVMRNPNQTPRTHQ